MDYAVIAIPAAPVRRKPNHRKEMVSQLLFGESVKVLKNEGDLWVKIRSLHDGYEGWITNTMLQPVNEKLAKSTNAFATTDMLSIVSIGDKQMNIPVGSSLPFFEDGKGRLGNVEYSFSGHYFKRDEQRPSADLVKQLTASWLNAPYLWGGRSPFGIDCSGFTQIVFKMLGKKLRRDASQQVEQGRLIDFAEQAQAADLAFFENERGKIVHVGIVMEGGFIIHAAGQVRIDKLDHYGIFNEKRGIYSHKLRIIRRLLPDMPHLLSLSSIAETIEVDASQMSIF